MKKKKKVKYTNEAIGNIHVMKDFLPDPENLVLKEETVKITLSLTKSSINYFKEQANLYHTQYQKMIRALVDQYAAQHQKKLSRK